jgi:hypothetical protein
VRCKLRRVDRLYSSLCSFNYSSSTTTTTMFAPGELIYWISVTATANIGPGQEQLSKEDIKVTTRACTISKPTAH